MDFKISVDETGEVARNINIEIPRSLFNERVHDMVRKTADQVSIKGFRKGKAPHHIVEKLYGDKVRSDVLGELVNNAYNQAVKGHSLNVVGYPNISIDETQDADGDLKFKAEVSLYPTPEIKDFRGLEVTVEKVEVTEESLEHEVKHLQEHYAELKPVDRTAAAKGDMVVMNYSGTVDGNAFPGSMGTGIQLQLGKSHMPPGFDSALEGQEVEVEKTFEITFPEDYATEELRGKTAAYSATITQIQQRVLPELNDELAKKSGMGETVDELRGKLKELLEKRVNEQNERAREDKLFKALAERNPFEIPQVMVDEEIRSILFEMRLLDPNDQRSYEFDVSRFRDALSSGAEFRVRRYIMLKQLIEQEQIRVDDSSIDAWFEEQAKEAGVDRKELEKAYGYPKNSSRIKEMLARQKAADLLFSSAKIEEEVKPMTHEGCEHD